MIFKTQIFTSKLKWLVFLLIVLLIVSSFLTSGTMAYSPGDINGDGEVNISDVTMVMRYVLGMIDLDEHQVTTADVNNDGVVDIGDVVLIIRYSLGLIDAFDAVAIADKKDVSSGGESESREKNDDQSANEVKDSSGNDEDRSSDNEENLDLIDQEDFSDSNVNDDSYDDAWNNEVDVDEDDSYDDAWNNEVDVDEDDSYDDLWN